MNPLFISQSEIKPGNLLGFLELTTDEQIAKKIYQATGDLTFKGFLPFTWNTAQIIKMRDAMQRLQAKGKLTILNMQIQVPSVSAAAHQFFITNAAKIKGILPENIQFDPGAMLKAFNPLLIVAGLAATAFIVVQIAPLLKAGKK